MYIHGGLRVKGTDKGVLSQQSYITSEITSGYDDFMGLRWLLGNLNGQDASQLNISFRVSTNVQWKLENRPDNSSFS